MRSTGTDSWFGLTSPVVAFGRMFWVVWAVVIGVCYLLPLSAPVTDIVSNGGFGLGMVVLIGCFVRAARHTRRLDRAAWISMAFTGLVTLVLFALDPAASNEEPTIALFLAPVLAANVLAAILIFARHAYAGIGLARLLTDGMWLTLGLFALSWPLAFAPLGAAGESRSWVFLAASLPVISSVAAVVTLQVLPRSTGSARLTLMSLGCGCAVIGVAGSFHVRLSFAGELVFGTWNDWAWNLGLSLIGLAALDPTIGARLRSARPTVRGHHIVTVAPVALGAIALAVGVFDSAAPPRIVTLLMLVVLAARVMTLTGENHALNSELRHRAGHDELTGLLNRRALLEALEAADASDADVAVMYLDLDRFKLVNDRFGHAAGDHLLMAVAHRLQANARPTDIVARLGGDEFVVIANPGHDADALAQRLQEAVSLPYVWENEVLEVGCSIGLAIRDGQASALGLLARADGALYEAKRNGQGPVSTKTVVSVD